MAHSNVLFERWKAIDRSTWPFQVFQRYENELHRIYLSHVAANRTLYKYLGAAQAEWADNVEKHLSFENGHGADIFESLKDWSGSFNEFANWVRLSAVVAVTSNLETYLAAAVRLAIDSDPGVLIGAPRAVDGVSFLKRQTLSLDVESRVESCTKGDWSSRVAAYAAVFGTVPPILTTKLSDLDAMRILRNKVGHAFGRDITQARMHGVKEMIPIERISADRLARFRRIAWAAAKSIDRHLLASHVGEYQCIRFYHNLVPALPAHVHPNQRAILFKKKIGQFKAQPRGKEYCYGLVNYYEAL
jgi:hypothetical protein